MDYLALITQVGFPSFITYLIIKEGFAYLRSRKDGGKDTEFNSKAILDELVKMNNNHLHSLEDAIQNGNKEIVKAITDGNFKMVEILGEIRGSLRK